MNKCEIKMKKGDVIIIDPCYIKNVLVYNESRFDTLKHIETIWDINDCAVDITFNLKNKEKTTTLFVESERIWIMVAEYNCIVNLNTNRDNVIHITDNINTTLLNMDITENEDYDEEENDYNDYDENELIMIKTNK